MQKVLGSYKTSKSLRAAHVKPMPGNGYFTGQPARVEVHSIAPLGPQLELLPLKETLCNNRGGTISHKPQRAPGFIIDQLAPGLQGWSKFQTNISNPKPSNIKAGERGWEFDSL